MPSTNLSRRAFLKLGGLALTGMAFRPVFPRPEEFPTGNIARVTVKELDLYSEPRDDSAIIGKRYRDQIVHIYEEVTGPKGPGWNPIWYRVWGGYLFSGYLQKVKVRFNQPLGYVPDYGRLCELTVPYSVAYTLSSREGWQRWPAAPLYYETIHWATDVLEGPDGEPWYQITSELTDGLVYHLPAAHLRPIPDEEISPISTDVPPEKKRIKISIPTQTLEAYEYDQVVLTTTISSGIPSRRPSPNGVPTETPKGRFRIYSKLPNKHMGSVTGNPDGDDGDRFSLPGVPWTSFFVNTGVALHGTYWHNNFGVQMSHGCVNMRNEDAKWIFRWANPPFNVPIDSRDDWEVTGYGTVVEVV